MAALTLQPLFPAWNADVLSGVPAATLDHKANEDGSHMLKMEMQSKRREHLGPS